MYAISEQLGPIQDYCRLSQLLLLRLYTSSRTRPTNSRLSKLLQESTLLLTGGSAPFVRRRCDCLASSAPFTNIQTYLLTQQCHSNDLEWSWVTYPNIQRHEASRGLSATAELFVFIGRQHTDARYWYSNSVCPSVCLSIRPFVRHVSVFYGNGLKHCHNFFTTR